MISVLPLNMDIEVVETLTVSISIISEMQTSNKLTQIYFLFDS